MILAFLGAITLIFSLQFFTLNFSIQGLNRSVIYTPVELFYPEIISNNGVGVVEVKSFQKRMMEYYDHTLSKYSKSYEVKFYYYNPDNDAMCIRIYCRAVEITVNADLIMNYKYHRVMFYEIEGNLNG